MPILGITASGISGHLTPPIVPAVYESIATQTVGSGGTSSVSFSSIPATYTHLQLRIMAKVTRATYPIGELKVEFNFDTGANYTVHDIYGDGSSLTLVQGSGQTSMRWGNGSIGTSTGGTFGVMIVDILDYANTSKYKTVRNFSGTDCNGTVGGLGGRLGQFSNLWSNTSAVSNIYITYGGGQGDFLEYSSFALYGIRG